MVVFTKCYVFTICALSLTVDNVETSEVGREKPVNLLGALVIWASV